MNSRSCTCEYVAVPIILAFAGISGGCNSEGPRPPALSNDEATASQVELDPGKGHPDSDSNPDLSPSGDHSAAFASQLVEVGAGERDTVHLINFCPSAQDLQQLVLHKDSIVDLLLDAGTQDAQSQDFKNKQDKEHPNEESADTTAEDSVISTISKLSELEHLRIRSNRISDRDLAVLVSGLRKLQILNLPQAQITADGIAKMTMLKNLQQLRIGGKQINDQAASEIAKLPSLRSLHLIGPNLTDAALDKLAKAPKLTSFYLDDCELSSAAWQRLFDAKPNIHVHVDQNHHDRDPNAHSH